MAVISFSAFNSQCTNLWHRRNNGFNQAAFLRICHSVEFVGSIHTGNSYRTHPTTTIQTPQKGTKRGYACASLLSWNVPL